MDTITKTVKRQRVEAAIDPIHAELEPVRRYAEWVSQLKKEPYLVVSVPEGTAAYGMGYRFVSIPESERGHYLANGAALACEARQ